MKSYAHLAAAVSASLFVAGAAAIPAASAQAMPVFDATNYAQNLLQAARALEQIRNQVTSLQNEAAMLEAMARDQKRVDFPELSRISGNLDQVDRLMGEARGIQFDVGKLEGQFDVLFPGRSGATAKGDEQVVAAKARLDAALEGFRHSMKVQSEIVSSIRGDAELLRDLSLRSEGAEGGLQAQQVANQLLALSTKQQFQIQDLLAAEFRSQALERARQAQEQSDARESTRRFLGSGRAYTPPRP